MRRSRTALASLAGVIALAASLTTAAIPAGAQATPSLTVSVSTVPHDRATTITVTGRNYLVPPHAPGTSVFGGIYLFFGWVADGGWGPSARNSHNNDGTFGHTYAYAGEGGDASTRDDPNGITRLVAFTPGGESGLTTPHHMDDAGNWSVTLVVPGPVFNTRVPSTGQVRTFDCHQVRCGVFTIGAHGKSSATNEIFTPISFTRPAPTPAPAPAPVPAPAPGTAPRPTAPAPTTTDAAPANPLEASDTDEPSDETSDEGDGEPGDDGAVDQVDDTDTDADRQDPAATDDPDAPHDDPPTVTVAQDNDGGGGGGAGFLIAGGAGVAALGAAVFVGLRRRGAASDPDALQPDP